jgi:hypothetical protein
MLPCAWTILGLLFEQGLKEAIFDLTHVRLLADNALILLQLLYKHEKLILVQPEARLCFGISMSFLSSFLLDIKGVEEGLNLILFPFN